VVVELPESGTKVIFWLANSHIKVAHHRLEFRSHIVYNSISRHHGVYTTKGGVDVILYYYNGKKLTPAEAVDVNTPLTELLDLLDSGCTNSKNSYYNSSKDMADQMRGIEQATHALTNALSILYRGEEIDDDAEN
jgi:hypothetical protein